VEQVAVRAVNLDGGEIETRGTDGRIRECLPDAV